MARQSELVEVLLHVQARGVVQATINRIGRSSGVNRFSQAMLNQQICEGPDLLAQMAINRKRISHIEKINTEEQEAMQFDSGLLPRSTLKIH
jgi:hypothetical protein